MSLSVAAALLASSGARAPDDLLLEKPLTGPGFAPYLLETRTGPWTAGQTSSRLGVLEAQWEREFSKSIKEATSGLGDFVRRKKVTGSESGWVWKCSPKHHTHPHTPRDAPSQSCVATPPLSAVRG